MNFLHCSGFGLVVALVAVAGCGDDGSSTPTTTTTMTTNAMTTSSTGGEEPTSGGPGTTQAATGETSTSTGPGTSATTDTGAGSTTEMGETSAGTSTGEPGESTGETGSVEVVPCTQDSDCTLVDDCCACEPIGPGEEAPACDIPECFATVCGPKGLGDAALQCRFGRCTFVKVDCNPTGVTCKSLPPECPGTEVPSVDVDAACWTGQCVPAEACDWVPDCAYCEEEELICVAKLQKGAYEVCEPKPVDCGDSDDIDCGCGQQVCDASPPHSVCIDVAGDIACECPVC